MQHVTEAFESMFAKALLVELRRQGVPRASERVDGFLERLRVDDAGAHLAFGGLGIGDKEGIALAEALLKLRTPSMVKTHGVARWMLSLENNALTDRSATHLSLLVSRCSPPLIKLDVRDNTMTSTAVEQIKEVHMVSSSSCILRLDVSIHNGPLTKCHAVVEKVSASLTISEALQRRRSALFKENSSTVKDTIPTEAVTTKAALVVETKSSRLKALEKLSRHCSSVGSVPVERDKRGASLCLEGDTPGHSSNDTVVNETNKSAQDAPIACATKGTATCSDVTVDGVSTLQHQHNDTGTQEDPFDITANLSPLLNTAVDLSNVLPTGKLRELYSTDSIWDVIGAHGTSPLPLPLGTNFQSLTVLNISRNGLRTMNALPASLLRLDVSENELSVLSGLEECRMLTLLNARRNQIRSISGLERNIALSHLFLGGNEISFVDGIAHLLVLDTLDLADNKLRTQASIRPLSLSGGLRCLMLRGNPVMERIKNSYRPLLRNLCPSLTIIDGCRLISSRLSEKAKRDCVRLQLQYAPHDDVNDLALASTGSKEEVADVSRCSSYLQLLTRGVTPEVSTGYSDPSMVARAAVALQTHKKKEKVERGVHGLQQKKRQRQQGFHGGSESLKREFLSRLALESKKYLESVLVERLASMQQSHVVDVSLSSADVSGHTKSPRVDRAENVRMSVPSDATDERGLGSWATAAADRPFGGLAAGDRQAALGRLGEGNYNTFSNGVHTTSLTAPNDRYAGGRRDETLNHNEWLQLRERLDPRRVSHPSFRHKPCKTLSRPVTPDCKTGMQEENAPNISPIRKNIDVSQMASTIVTQILSEKELAAPAEDRGGACLRVQKAKSSLIKASVERPVLLSPFSYSSPDKPCRSSVSSRSPRTSTQTSLRSASRRDCTTVPKEPILLSPVSCLLSPNPKGDRSSNQIIKEWVVQLYEDAEAVQDALRTIVVLLDTQQQGAVACQPNLTVTPECVSQERKHCVNILKESGMLLDTEIPQNIAEYYRFTTDELNCKEDDQSGEEEEEEDSDFNPRNLLNEDDLPFERSRILRCIRLISDAKTCLRYLTLLIEEEKERALWQYVDEIRDFVVCQ